eukprot:jgi/Psemu1/50886/gm1.50886_g
MPTPFDWTPIFGIEFRFASASNPTAATSLNKAYSEIVGKDELSEFFVTRDSKEEEGPLEMAPDPQLHILHCAAKAIAINPIDPDKVAKGHISNLLNQCVIKHVRNDGSRKRMRYKTEFDAAAKHAIRTNTDEEPIVLFELTITHWRFRNKWRPDLFMQAYTEDPPSATVSRAQFANLLQQKYTTPKAAPPDAPILAPIKPAEAKKVNATISSGATGLVHTKTVNSNAVAIPVKALSGPPANFRRTLFTPQRQSMLVFRCLPNSVPSPQPSLRTPPLPSEAPAENTDPPNAAPAYIRSLQSPCHNQIFSRPTHPPVFCITKRHRDALKIKMRHLYANLLPMNWFYDTFD